MKRWLESRLRVEQLETRDLLTISALELPQQYFSAGPYSFYEEDDVAYFRIYEGAGEIQFWQSDGTSSGTHVVDDVSDFVFPDWGSVLVRTTDSVASLFTSSADDPAERIYVDALVPFGDGSVRSIDKGIDRDALVAMVTRSGH